MSDVAKLVEQVEQSIMQRKLFRRGQAILVAVSGGLDSMVLLHLLAPLAKAHGWRLTVAHFNHQLRGRSSDADERLVGRTAKKLGLVFVANRASVWDFAREYKLSLEMAGRKLRHDFLAREAVKRGIRRIALAHHADDQVELFFLRLLRGAGGEGLAGMKWASPSPANSKITLVRPLLDQPKSALSYYAKSARVPFREDATNAQLDIQRNRIRHELIPWLGKNYQPALARVILRQMEVIGAESDFVTQTAKEWLERKRQPPFELLPVAVQRRCLQLQLVALGMSPGFDLIEKLRETADLHVSVGDKVIVLRDVAGILHAQQLFNQVFSSEARHIELTGKAGEIAFENAQIRWKRVSIASGAICALKQHPLNCETFDADKVGSNIVLRHWQPGDRFQPIGMEKAVKLQDLFTNHKIPRAQRHHLLVGTTAGGELFWVEGLRMGERFKLDKNSQYGLKWSWERL